MNIEKFFFMSVTTVVSLKKVVGSTVTRKLGRVCSSALYCINFWLSFWMEVTHCGFWEWFFGLTRWPNLLVGCTIDCHSEISSSLVCSWTCAWIQFAWSCTTIGDRFQFVQSGPAWRMFQIPPFPLSFIYDLWVPPFHCCFYLLFWSFLCHFLVPFQVTKPPVKLKCH